VKVLIASPLLSCQGDFATRLRIRSAAIAGAGVEVLTMGAPPAAQFRDLPASVPYVSVFDRLSPRWRAFAAWGQRRLRMVWQYIVEPCWVQYAAIREARRQNIPVVFFSEVEPLSLLPILWLTGGRKIQPVVGTMACMYSMKSSLKGMPFYTKIRSELNRRALMKLPQLSHVSCDCMFSAEQAGVPAGDTLHIAPEGLCRREQSPALKAAARQKLGIPADRRMLMLFGVASPAKGADLLFQALEKVPPTFDLYVVGKTGDQYLKSWGNTDRLDALGWKGHLHIVSRFVPDEERDAFFAACDAVVMPYRYGFPCISGVLTQAIEHGKAAIVSDQFEIGRIVRTYDLGILIPPGDEAALVESLKQFATLPPEWFEAIRLRSHRMVDEYTWERIGTHYRQLFEHVAGVTAGMKKA
jgi:glycosyltransferase involved in cell wall biosynthesis